MTGMPRLWHFTCDHGHRGIGSRGILKPHLHQLMPRLGPVVWLTTDGVPDRYDVGLTSVRLSCDRMAFRYRVTTEKPPVVPWSVARTVVDPHVVADLESFAEPSTWWLATAPVEAVLA